VNYGENMSDTQFDRMVATGEEVVMLDADNDNDEEYIHHASGGTSHPVTVTNSNGSNSKGKHGSKKQANSKASKEQAFARANATSGSSDGSRQMSAPQPVQQHTTGSIGKLHCYIYLHTSSIT
jgi:cell division septation protein DedD